MSHCTPPPLQEEALFSLPNLPDYEPPKIADYERLKSAFPDWIPPRLVVGSNSVRLNPCIFIGGKREPAKRKDISEFSFASKTRFERKLEGFSHLNWKYFLTLTFQTKSKYIYCPVIKAGRYFPVERVGTTEEGNNEFQDMKYCYALLKAFVRAVDAKLKKKFGSVPLWAWKKEFQSNGTVHFHLLCTAKLKFQYKGDWFVNTFMAPIWCRLTGNVYSNSVDYDRIKKKYAAAWYMSKYVSKHDKRENPYCTKPPVDTLCNGFIGRWWGFFNIELYQDRFLNARVHYISLPLFSSIYSLLVGLKGEKPDWENLRSICFSRFCGWGRLAWKKILSIARKCIFSSSPPSDEIAFFEDFGFKFLGGGKCVAS